MAFIPLPAKNGDVCASPTGQVGASGAIGVPWIIRTVPNPFRGEPVLRKLGEVRTDSSASKRGSSHESESSV
jgi:hypothetical protein